VSPVVKQSFVADSTLPRAASWVGVPWRMVTSRPSCNFTPVSCIFRFREDKITFRRRRRFSIKGQWLLLSSGKPAGKKELELQGAISRTYSKARGRVHFAINLNAPRVCLLCVTDTRRKDTRNINITTKEGLICLCRVAGVASIQAESSRVQSFYWLQFFSSPPSVGPLCSPSGVREWN